MPRDVSGTYTLPAGINPVVSGTVIESAWANTTLADIAAALTDSLSRTGLGGMTGAFRFADGSKPAPGIAWANETTMGFYRATTNDMRLAITNTDIQQWTPSLVGINAPVLMNSTLRLNNALYMPNSSSIWFKDLAAVDMPVVSANAANDVLWAAGASWLTHYWYVAGVIKMSLSAAALAVSTNITATGNITAANALVAGTTLAVSGVATFGTVAYFLDSIDIVNGIYAIGNNRSIYFRAADTNPYAVLGVSAANAITLGSAFSMIYFTIQNVECARINASGGFKAKTFSGGAYAAADAIHEFSVNNTGNYTLAVGNVAAGTPYGIDIAFHSFAPGSRGYGNYYIAGRDTGGALFAMASNGGLLNYSALNVNLSDARAKRDVRDTEDFTPIVRQLSYKRFRFSAMPQAGEVLGVLAQDVERLDKRLVVDKALGSFKGVLDNQLQAMINSVIPRLIHRIEQLEAR